MTFQITKRIIYYYYFLKKGHLTFVAHVFLDFVDSSYIKDFFFLFTVLIAKIIGFLAELVCFYCSFGFPQCHKAEARMQPMGNNTSEERRAYQCACAVAAVLNTLCHYYFSQPVVRWESLVGCFLLKIYIYRFKNKNQTTSWH